MQNFTRVIPKHNYENWPEKLSKMGALFHEVEYQTVKRGLRQGAIIHIHPENLQNILEKTNKDGLILTPLTKTSISNGFSILVKSPQPGESFLWQSCITKSYQDSQKLKIAHSKNDHKTIGMMLGYPSCCIDYFIRTFPLNNVPVWLDLEGKIRGYPECNGLLRYFSPIIISHFSCSPICEATRKIGKSWLRIMQEIDKNLADELYNLLAGPITWNSYHGVAQIETPYFVGLNNDLFLLKKPRIIIWEGIKKPFKKTSLKRKLKKQEKFKIKENK